MVKKYNKPEILSLVLNTEDIIMTSDTGNPLMSGSFNTTSGLLGSTTFNNDWISDSFSDQ